MSDTRTNEQLAEIAHYGISRYCDECPLVACGPGDDCHAAVDELVRRADEAAVYKLALSLQAGVEDGVFVYVLPSLGRPKVYDQDSRRAFVVFRSIRGLAYLPGRGDAMQRLTFRILSALGIWRVCDRIDGRWRLK